MDRPFEEQVGGADSPKPFVADSEMALKTTAKSTSASLRLPSSRDKNNRDEIMFEHDEISLEPIEDSDVLKNILNDQNAGCCDQALEKCLSFSMIPEELVERLLCQADRTLATCQTTDWMEETTGYSMCRDEENGSDNYSKCRGGAPSSMSNETPLIARESRLHLPNFNMEPKGPVIVNQKEAFERKIAIEVVPEDRIEIPDGSKCKIVSTILIPELDNPITLDSHERYDTNDVELNVSGYSDSSWKNSIQTLTDKELSAFRKEHVDKRIIYTAEFNSYRNHPMHYLQLRKIKSERMRRLDDDESGFECVLQHDSSLEKKQEDEPTTISSPTKLSLNAEDIYVNQRIVTPSPEKKNEYKYTQRLGKFNWKISLKLTKTKAEF